MSADDDDSVRKPPLKHQESGSHVHVDGVNASIIRAKNSRQQVEDSAAKTGVFFPWRKQYKLWWGVTVFCTFATAFYETYMVAFGKGQLVV